MISELQILPVKPVNGLIGFASFVLNNELYLSSIGIYRKLGGGYRLTYPAKQVGERQLNIYHPINKQLGLEIETAISEKCRQVFERSDEHHDRHGQAATPRGAVPADEA